MRKLTKHHLTEAAELLWQERMAEIREAAPLEPSAAFDQRMKRLIQEGIRQEEEQRSLYKKGARRVLVCRVIAAAAIVLAILLGWLLFDKTAYAKIGKWFKWISGKEIHYSFPENTDVLKEELPVYRLGWIPEGAEIILEEESEELHDYRIVLAFNEDIVVFEYGLMVEGIEMAFFDLQDRELKTETIQINDMEIECLLNVDDNDNAYLWVNEQSGVYFSMTSSLPHSENIKILERIQKQ